MELRRRWTGTFAAPYVFTDSVEALAHRWIGEERIGHEGRVFDPVLSKLGFNAVCSQIDEQKLIRLQR